VAAESSATTAESGGGFRMSRIGRESAVYLAGVLATKAVAFIMLPLYTRYLTPADYGTLMLIEITMEVVSIVAGARISSGIFHFFHKAEDQQARRLMLATSQTVLSGAFAGAGLLAFLAAPWLSRLLFGSDLSSGLIRIAAVTLALQGAAIVPIAWLQLNARHGAVVRLNLAKLVVQLALNVLLLVGYGLGVAAILWSSLVANALTGIALAVMLARSVGAAFSRAAAAEVVRFGAPFVGTHLAKFVVTYGDRYYLQAAAGTAVVGVYGLAYQFGFLLATLADGPFRSAWEPVRFAVAKRPDRDAVYARAFIHLNLIQVTMGVAISLGVPEFLRVMATPPFFEAANWVPIILAAYLLQSWSFFLNAGLFVTERTGLITWATWLGAGAAVAGYVALIPPLGALGASLATLLSFLVLFYAVYRYSQREWPVAYRWGPVLRLLATAVAVCGAAYLLPPLSLPAAVGAKAALFAVFVGMVWVLGALSASEKALLRMMVVRPRDALAALGS
jgi:O-antigen/teichoic acid export membrane protein